MKVVATAGLVPSSFRTLPCFNVTRAASIADAIKAVGQAERPAFLAGGTDLPAQFNEGFIPSDLIDLSRIDDLRKVTLANNAIEIGATVTHAAGSTDLLVCKHLPSLASAWARIANVRIRFSATLGGNLMARRTRYEGAILLSALQARLRLQSAAGETEIPVEDVWTKRVPSAALLTHIIIPLRNNIRLDYARDLRPIMTQAVGLDDSRTGRIVTATEYAVPCVRLLKAANREAVQGDLDLADPVTSAGYLRSASDALLVRQLERMRMQ